MTQLDGKSKDLVNENIEKLKEIFPEVFSEGKIDFSKLEEELGNFKSDENERYNFTWNGKSEAKKIALTPSTGTLRPCKTESKDWDTTQNLYIEGDNLEVLKLLQKSYHKKVKMIYIDPPYNTGKDFVYKDNFRDNIKNYLEITGQVDSDGNKLSTNSETSGRYHSDWLNMMYPRLKLARNLLKDDGVIFISIDDNEVANLRKLCDEIFGEDNYINQISIKAKPSAGASGGGEDKKLKKNIEYLLCYTKSRNIFIKFNDVWDSKNLFEYIKEYKETGKSWKYTRVLYSLGEKKHFIDTIDGSGEKIKIFKHQNVIIKTIAELSKEEKMSEEDIYIKYFEQIFRDTNAQSSIRQRVLESTDKDDTFYSIEYIPKSGRNKNNLTTLYYKGRNKDLLAWLSDVAEKENSTLLKKDKIGTLWSSFNWNNVSKEGDIQYPNGKKPIDFIKRMIQMITTEEKNEIILDFFAGSGSTAHAVIDYNYFDDGTRKSISIQMPESVSDKDKKELYSKEEFQHINTVCDIHKARIKKVGEKIQADNPNKDLSNLDIGFKVLKLDSSNIKSWDSDFENLQTNLLDSIENIKSDRNENDLVYEILLKYGLDLTLPIQELNINNKKIYSIGFGSLVCCLDNDIDTDTVEKIAELKKQFEADYGLENMRVVFKDSSFKDSVVKTNALQILKQNGINEVVSV